MRKGLGFLAAAVLASISMPLLTMAAPIETQQQIIAQKEQEQASRRAEQEL